MQKFRGHVSLWAVFYQMKAPNPNPKNQSHLSEGFLFLKDTHEERRGPLTTSDQKLQNWTSCQKYQRPYTGVCTVFGNMKWLVAVCFLHPLMKGCKIVERFVLTTGPTWLDTMVLSNCLPALTEFGWLVALLRFLFSTNQQMPFSESLVHSQKVANKVFATF